MPNRADDDAVAVDAVKDDIGSAADDQFARLPVGSRATKVWMASQGFDDSNDSSG